ncbi:MAG: RNA methyltransferase [Archangiaceae bacterium]|nr:RNA methyltransferase [Archangiaceae bacterium]
MPERLPLFATTARGTEELLAAELTALGAKKVRQDRGGVRFHANLDEALRIVMWTRLAMRVLYPLGEFDAPGAEGLYEAARKVPWAEHLSRDTTFAVEATLRDTEHNHSGFVALKVKDAIVDTMRDAIGSRPDVDTKDPAVRVVAHLRKTQLSLSLDLAGEPLHRRGYREETTDAPLKETLAAAMLAAADYRGEEPFADPMCGSGTLVIEAGLIAINRAPGLSRRFAVERWPKLGQHARSLLGDLKREAKAAERPPPSTLLARDFDEDALAATTANLRAAGLWEHVTIEQLDATMALPPDGPPGLLGTNPPYGERIGGGRGGQKGIKSFYFKLGDALTEWVGWRSAVLAGNPGFESAFHMKPQKRMNLWNGPIECQLLLYPARFKRGR